MQTFLPTRDFLESARVLDYRRLGKQRLECAQLLRANGDFIVSIGPVEVDLTVKHGWVNHPCAHMWSGHGDALKVYMDAMVTEWVCRGYKNNYDLWFPEGAPSDISYPAWLGDEDFHKAHRRALLFKTDYYDQFDWPEMQEEGGFWEGPLSQIYWWPRWTDDSKTEYVLKRKGEY